MNFWLIECRRVAFSVVELPYAPHIRSELINGTKSVNVSWLPDFDGNSPITGFLLEFKQVGDGDPTAAAALDIGWHTLLSNFSATDRFYVVRDLRPSASYQFRVSAVNNVGEGSPSAASGPILLPQTPPTSAPKFAASSRNSTAVMVQWQVLNGMRYFCGLKIEMEQKFFFSSKKVLWIN